MTAESGMLSQYQDRVSPSARKQHWEQELSYLRMDFAAERESQYNASKAVQCSKGTASGTTAEYSSMFMASGSDTLTALGAGIVALQSLAYIGNRMGVVDHKERAARKKAYYLAYGGKREDLMAPPETAVPSEATSIVPSYRPQIWKKFFRRNQLATVQTTE